VPEKKYSKLKVMVNSIIGSLSILSILIITDLQIEKGISVILIELAIGFVLCVLIPFGIANLILRNFNIYLFKAQYNWQSADEVKTFFPKAECVNCANKQSNPFYPEWSKKEYRACWATATPNSKTVESIPPKSFIFNYNDASGLCKHWVAG